MITLEDVKQNEEVKQLVLSSQKQLNALGYPEIVKAKIEIQKQQGQSNWLE